MKHIPSFIEKSEALRTQRAIDQLVCVSVNDVFVMDAWGKVCQTAFLNDAAPVVIPPCEHVLVWPAALIKVWLEALSSQYSWVTLGCLCQTRC